VKILFATRNKGKLAELYQLLGDEDFELIGLDDLADPPEEVEETGSTFAENAELKARAAMLATGLPSLADDSGLEVDALDGRPGVFSARYGSSDRDRVERLLGELDGVPAEERSARFRCAVVFMHPDEPEAPVLREGSCEGTIIEQPRGHNGFGYDPVFYVEQIDQTFAEAVPDVKNRLSHRGKAMQQLAEHLHQRYAR
jgi:XTP/dITP diphosphohydrolase